jgi:hypothetical protein
MLAKLQHSRETRNPEIIRKLKKLGIQLSLAEIRRQFDAGPISRPHIAHMMVQRGHVGSIEEAFENYLGNGRPAYVDKFRISCAAAITSILDAGGIPVLAHPCLLNSQSKEQLNDLVVNLMAIGIRGIEVYYPANTPEQTQLYESLAKRYGLFMTGGTDFHGDLTPGIKLGTGRGDLLVPYGLYEALVREGSHHCSCGHH